MKIKSNKVRTIISAAILVSVACLFTSGKIDTVQEYISATTLAQSILPDIATLAVANVARAGMFAEIKDPEFLELAGKKYAAKVYYCPLPGEKVGDMPVLLSKAISQSAIDCSATTPTFRQVEIEISLDGKRIYTLPTAIVDKHR